ncbi:MAG: hypothetical protein ACO398_08335 [Kiritimatiellia bacterium]
MSKKLMYALILIVLVVIVLLMTKGNTSVNLVFTEFSASRSMIFLGFTGVGTIIGLLLK